MEELAAVLAAQRAKLEAALREDGGWTDDLAPPTLAASATPEERIAVVRATLDGSREELRHLLRGIWEDAG